MEEQEQDTQTVVMEDPIPLIQEPSRSNGNIKNLKDTDFSSMKKVTYCSWTEMSQ